MELENTTCQSPELACHSSSPLHERRKDRRGKSGSHITPQGKKKKKKEEKGERTNAMNPDPECPEICDELLYEPSLVHTDQHGARGPWTDQSSAGPAAPLSRPNVD